jgi:hypothetical protein
MSYANGTFVREMKRPQKAQKKGKTAPLPSYFDDLDFDEDIEFVGDEDDVDYRRRKKAHRVRRERESDS